MRTWLVFPEPVTFITIVVLMLRVNISLYYLATIIYNVIYRSLLLWCSNYALGHDIVYSMHLWS